jgi:signal transduction histidine kinase
MRVRRGHGSTAMLWLQVFNRDRVLRHWPLSPVIARALSDVLIFGAGDSTREAIAGTALPPEIRRQLACRLADDPLLALWCSSRAACSSPAHELRTAEDVVDWLASHALAQLRSDPEILSDRAVVDVADATEVARAADLVQRAAALAHLSGTLARAHDDRAGAAGSTSRLPDVAAHLARLVVAATWFEMPGERTESTIISSAGQLPASVEVMLGELRSTSSASQERPAAGFVNAAGRRLAEYREGALPDDAAVKDALAHGQATRERWLDPSDATAGATLREVVAGFGRLAELKTQFAVALEREKLAALAEFAGGAGHEINNPLAVIAGRAQLLLPGERDPQRRRELAVIGAQAMRIHEMIADLMLFARPPLMNKAACDLGELVEESLTPFREVTRQREIQLVYHRPSEPVVVPADAVQLLVALSALVRNSLEALVDSGRIEVSLDWMTGPNADRCAEIVVRDNGPGVSDDVRRHLFDPYYSGRPAGRGLGLGLSKCWRIVTAHSGVVDFDSEPGRGATFRLRLPE